MACGCPGAHRLGGVDRPERWAPESKLKGKEMLSLMVSQGPEVWKGWGGHQGGLGPTAHLTNEEAGAQRCPVIHTRPQSPFVAQSAS